jgi:hypothetical protein
MTVIWIADTARERIRGRVMAEAWRLADDAEDLTRCADPSAGSELASSDAAS